MGKVLHASYSGYFPSCIGTARTTGVVKGSLSQIMSMYWRVKTWELSSATGSYIVHIDEDNTVSYEFTEGTKELGSTNATSEEALVCSQYFNRSVLITTIVNSTYLPGPPSTIYTSFGFLYYPNISKSGENYQMTCQAGVEFAGTDLFSTLYEGLTVGQIYLSPLDISIPLRAPVGADASGNVNIALNATEWWSYGGLYDTATGELT